MLLAVGGMSRSGTTLLVHLLNTHPDIYLTHEMRIFINIGEKQSKYRGTLSPIFGNNLHLLDRPDIVSHAYRICFHLLTFIYWKRPITFERIRNILSLMWHKYPIIGDKWPRYHFHLQNLTQYTDGLKIVMINRDGRDVIASFMKKIHTDWAGLEWIHNLSTVEEVAVRWLNAIESIQKHQESIFIIRYEDLVQDPRPILQALGNYLGVDGALFDETVINTGSIGKYKQSLTAKEIQCIEGIIGDKLQSLGYEI